MKRINWNDDKAHAIQADKTRNNVSLHDCAVAIEEGRILDDLDHPLLSHQRLFILEFNAYAYVVPYVETDEEIFLKTVYPSRKHTSIYLTS